MNLISTRLTRRRQKTRPRSLMAALRGQNGAIDLASIMTGVLVIGIIGAVIAATVFAVVPWSQDAAAKGNLHAAAQAEGVVRTAGTEPVYLQYDSTSTDHLVLEQSSPGGIQRPGQRLIVDTNASGTTYVAAQLSATGQVFLSTSDDPMPRSAVAAGYVLAGYSGHPGVIISTLSAPAGFIVPAGIASTVPQALIHAEVTPAPYAFAAASPAAGAQKTSTVIMTASDLTGGNSSTISYTGPSISAYYDGTTATPCPCSGDTSTVAGIKLRITVPASLVTATQPVLGSSATDAASSWSYLGSQIIGSDRAFDYAYSGSIVSTNGGGSGPPIFAFPMSFARQVGVTGTGSIVAIFTSTSPFVYGSSWVPGDAPDRCSFASSAISCRTDLNVM